MSNSREAAARGENCSCKETQRLALCCLSEFDSLQRPIQLKHFWSPGASCLLSLPGEPSWRAGLTRVAAQRKCWVCPGRCCSRLCMKEHCVKGASCSTEGLRTWRDELLERSSWARSMVLRRWYPSLLEVHNTCLQSHQINAWWLLMETTVNANFS